MPQYGGRLGPRGSVIFMPWEFLAVNREHFRPCFHRKKYGTFNGLVETIPELDILELPGLDSRPFFQGHEEVRALPGLLSP